MEIKSCNLLFAITVFGSITLGLLEGRKPVDITVISGVDENGQENGTTGQNNAHASARVSFGDGLEENFDDEFHKNFDHDFNKDLNHDFTKDFNHDFAKKFNHDLTKELNHDFTNDFNHDFTKDFNHDFTKDFNHDFTKDFNHDFTKDFNQDFNNNFNGDSTKKFGNHLTKSMDRNSEKEIDKDIGHASDNKVDHNLAGDSSQGNFGFNPNFVHQTNKLAIDAANRFSNKNGFPFEYKPPGPDFAYATGGINPFNTYVKTEINEPNHVFPNLETRFQPAQSGDPNKPHFYSISAHASTRSENNNGKESSYRRAEVITNHDGHVRKFVTKDP